MSASAGSQEAANRGEIGPETDLAMLKSPPSEIKCINARHGGCCADGMDVSTYTAVDGAAHDPI
jgi:hypothetical protein